MVAHFYKLALIVIVMGCAACVLEPDYGAPPPPAYGYYAAPAYPWALGADINIGRGYGRGYYGGGSYGGGGFGRGGGGRR